MESFFPFNFNTVAALGGVIFACAYAWEKFRSGGKKADEEYEKSREDLITRLNEQLDAQRQINDSLREQYKDTVDKLQELTLQFGEMKGKLAGYEAILQNRKVESQGVCK